MDKVFIKSLKVRGVLGIHEWERVATRDIIISVTLFVDSRPAAQSDDIADCVNYSQMADKLRAHAEHAARMTVEALANDLAQICLQDDKVLRVILRVDKPGAVPDAESVGVEVERAHPS
ncbi:MAG: bifunctional dihydroneopterin aldolase/7,8-dihydroneopterin epimerase [Anaerolineales bacterium]